MVHSSDFWQAYAAMSRLQLQYRTLPWSQKSSVDCLAPKPRLHGTALIVCVHRLTSSFNRTPGYFPPSFFFYLNAVSPSSAGCCVTLHGDQAGLRDMPASASGVLELKDVCHYAWLISPNLKTLNTKSKNTKTKRLTMGSCCLLVYRCYLNLIRIYLTAVLKNTAGPSMEPRLAW